MKLTGSTSLTGSHRSQKRLSRRKMKFLIFTLISLAIVLGTVASVLPKETKVGVGLTKKISSFVDSFNEKDLGEGGSSYERADVKTLKLVQVVFRHGDRTPIDRFPKDQYNSLKYWPEGWGRLTNRGKVMHQQLGKFLRKRYDGFIGKVYRPEEIFVISSDKDRTIQSAMANLAAMWPPAEDVELGLGEIQQFVPIHSISSELDNKIAFTRSCPKYKAEFNEVNDFPSEKAFNEENVDLYKFLSETTGLKITSYFNVSDVYDTLFVQTCHNYSLPAWTESVYPEKLRLFAERWIRANTFTKKMRELRGGPILTDFVRNMKRAIGNPDEKGLLMLEELFGTPYAKFYMYSGHDTTLSAILDSLGVYDGKIPPYASSLYFELHQNEDDNSYFVKVLYRRGVNGTLEEQVLPFCDSAQCRFDDFFKGIELYMIDDKEWDKKCAI